MGPKIEKKEKPIKGDEAEEMVLQYLRSVNRPYASTDVSTNLKGKVAKPKAQKALTALAERGLLTVKPYGKQTIFVYNQSQLPVLDAKEMTRLDGELKASMTMLDDVKRELKGLQLELGNKVALPKTKELGKEIARIKADNDLTTQALLPFRGESAAPPMSVETTEKIDRDWVKWRKEWTARRSVYKEMIGTLGDSGFYTNRAEFEEEQGVVTDDMEESEIERVTCKGFNGSGHGQTKRGGSGGDVCGGLPKKRK